MAKDLTTLMDQLRSLGKVANSVESTTDPTEKGTASTNVDKDNLIAPLAGQDASLVTTPVVSATEPAGDSKVEPGKPTGDVPGAQPFTETASPGSGKSAGFLTATNDLRTKLANFGKEAAQATPATESAAASAAVVPAAGAVADPAKKKEEACEAEGKCASYVPGDYMMKVATYLMGSARGLSVVNDALDEILGQEATSALLKNAADENVAFLRDYTTNRLQQADAEIHQWKQAEAQRLQDEAYADLIKGASAEDLAKIEDSAILLKQAAAIFAENPLARGASEAGFAAANKVAAAIEQGMPPEEAAAAATGPQEGPPSPEELEAALMALVQQGVITQEDAEQMLMQLMGGGDPSGAGDPMAGQELPPELAQKQAAANQTLDAIAAKLFV